MQRLGPASKASNRQRATLTLKASDLAKCTQGAAGDPVRPSPERNAAARQKPLQPPTHHTTDIFCSHWHHSTAAPPPPPLETTKYFCSDPVTAVGRGESNHPAVKPSS
nr:hypothetical protein CFP56_78170 [Quercus suber]